MTVRWTALARRRLAGAPLFPAVRSPPVPAALEVMDEFVAMLNEIDWLRAGCSISPGPDKRNLQLLVGPRTRWDRILSMPALALTREHLTCHLGTPRQVVDPGELAADLTLWVLMDPMWISLRDAFRDEDAQPTSWEGVALSASARGEMLAALEGGAPSVVVKADVTPGAAGTTFLVPPDCGPLRFEAFSGSSVRVTPMLGPPRWFPTLGRATDLAWGATA